MYSRFSKHLPFINLAVTTTALTFQTTVLYPWHNKLSKQLEKIEVKIR
jgi:hypothetical protein